MSEAVTRAERLLNLVLCLMAAERPVTREQIERGVRGYSESVGDGAVERMFERDKEELRSMGVPVETVDTPAGTGYRILPSQYALPDIPLDDAERTAVALAAQVWARGAVDGLPATAVRKLESVASDGWTSPEPSPPALLTGDDAALAPLIGAVTEGVVIRFPYRRPDRDEEERRTVTPWGLRSSDGRWFLVGWDHAREAPRTFRVSRISGSVSTARALAPHGPPEGFDVTTADTDAGGTPPVSAVVRVAPGRAMSLRALSEADPAAPEIVVTAPSLRVLVARVCAAGPDAAVLAPADVVAAVRSALLRLVDVHPRPVAPEDTP
jgi:proteasome accessory factor B